MEKELLKMITRTHSNRYLSFISTASLSGKEKRTGITNLYKKIAKVVAGMANADGGIVVVGMEEGVKVTGLSFINGGIPELERRISRYISPPPPIRSTRIKIKGGEVIVIEVGRSLEIHTLKDGNVPYRSGFSTFLLSKSRIERFLEKKEEGTYEGRIVEKATLSDLDVSLLQRLKILLGDDRNPAAILCEKYGLLIPHGATYKVSVGALLLFAKEPLRWIPQSSIEIVKFSGKYNTEEEFNVEARVRFDLPLFSIIETATNKIEEMMKEKVVAKDLYFTGLYTFPKIIWKEALLNAFVHRDYKVQTPIKVFIYDDIMEISNPGSPPPFVTDSLSDYDRAENLTFYRNPLIARVLSDCGFIKGIGDGFMKIYRTIKRESLLIPEIKKYQHSFTISIPLTPILSDEVRDYMDKWEGPPLSGRELSMIGFALSHTGRFSTKDIKNITGLSSKEAYNLARKMVEMGIAHQEKGKFSRMYSLIIKKEKRDKVMEPGE